MILYIRKSEKSYSKNSINFVNGLMDWHAILASSEPQDVTEEEGFKYKKKFLDPKFISFSSGSKPARTTKISTNNDH